MSSTPQSSASSWFQATEALGDFIGIRFGRIPHGSDMAEWTYLSHVQYDGIGGFARILRDHGGKLPPLASTTKPCRKFWRPLWNLLFHQHPPSNRATRRDWVIHNTLPPGPPEDVSWHLFSEQETLKILSHCRNQRITVNSLLLKLLDAAVRPELGIHDKAIPWMIPVNLRGDVLLADDTENHVSCVDALVSPQDSPQHIQQQILKRIELGEHRANFLLMQLSRWLGLHWKMMLLQKVRASPHGNIGTFSNLGAWDSEKQLPIQDSWLFCPPIVCGQRLSAGCVTFQNRLALTIQTHLTSTQPAITPIWMKRWVDGLENPASTH